MINYYCGTKQLLPSGTAAALGYSRAFTMLLHKQTMSQRIEEEKDGRRVSSTVLGKRKSTGDGATSRPTPRTPDRVNQAGMNGVPRSKGTVQEPRPKSSRRQVLQRTLVVLQRCALIWARLMRR